jgi:hypothetical protein
LGDKKGKKMQINNVADLKNLTNNHSIFSDVRQKVADRASAGIACIQPCQMPASSINEIGRILENIIRIYDDSPLYVQLHIREIFSDSLERMYDQINNRDS